MYIIKLNPPKCEEPPKRNFREECTLLICSCEKYSDLHKPFFQFFDLFWPLCPFDIVLATDTPGYELGFTTKNPVKIVSTGYGKSWCQMLCEALDAIQTPAVMLMMDDYFLTHPIRTRTITDRLHDFFRFKALNLRLSPNPIPNYPVTDAVWEYTKNTAYCISCQTGFWDKVFLRGLASRFSSAWQFERKGSFALNPKDDRPILAVTERVFYYLDSVHKGYWEKEALALAEKNDVRLDFSRRTLPPWHIKTKEWVKKIVFNAMPKNLLLRIQNLFS